MSASGEKNSSLLILAMSCFKKIDFKLWSVSIQVLKLHSQLEKKMFLILVRMGVFLCIFFILTDLVGMYLIHLFGIHYHLP